MTDVPPTLATHDVLIVGAGTFGLTLGNDLLRRDISAQPLDAQRDKLKKGWRERINGGVMGKKLRKPPISIFIETEKLCVHTFSYINWSRSASM